MTQPSSDDALSVVVTELLGKPLVDTPHVKQAAGLVAAEIKQRHHRDHALRQRMGCLIDELQRRGVSWREIYETTGVVQRTLSHWRQLYLTEGITPQPADELDTRAFGKDQDESQ